MMMTKRDVPLAFILSQGRRHAGIEIDSEDSLPTTYSLLSQRQGHYDVTCMSMTADDYDSNSWSAFLETIIAGRK